jgi:hypothetical protein
MIVPTVGRVVWFWKDTKQSQPLAAMIAFVHNDRMVNLGYLTAEGAHIGAMSVPLIQEGDERPARRFCEWLPYQKGQAAKTEQLEAQLAKAGAP